MIALGLDTSSAAGSVGVVSSGGLPHAEINLRAGLTHSERLLPSVRALLDVAGVRMEEIDLFAVAAGPGSFTGLRIGMAAAKGLALACGRPLVGFSTLETIARASAPWAARGDAAVPVCVLLDAGRGEVYRGLFRVAGTRVEPLVAEAALPPEQAVAGVPGGCLVVGDGLTAHAERLGPLPADVIRVARAPFIGAMLARRALDLLEETGAGRLPPLVPNYLRVSDAERSWRG
jgi:tRNA threonylcarbamoyladenosine biosynthesis protein TsaB